MKRQRIVLVIVALAVALALAALTSLLLLSKGAAPPAPEATIAGAPESAPLEEKKAVAKDDRPAPPPLPERPIVVKKDGVTRVLCVGACAIEARCGLREENECVQSSCEGEVRKANRADFALAEAADCAAAAETPCEEACWKRGECTGDHASDAQCTAACKRLVRERPAQIYAENRCVLESACPAIAACGGT